MTPVTDHADGCYSWGPSHYECARRRIAELAGEMVAQDELLLKTVCEKNDRIEGLAAELAITKGREDGKQLVIAQLEAQLTLLEVTRQQRDSLERQCIKDKTCIRDLEAVMRRARDAAWEVDGAAHIGCMLDSALEPITVGEKG